MARENPTEFAILGLLAEGPRSGYDVKRDVEEILSHFWSESFGHIYPMLRRLHGRGLVKQRVISRAGRPDRKVYSITAKGRTALKRWFTQPPAAPRPRNELLLRLFFGRHAEPGQLTRDVRHYRDELLKARERLEEVKARLDAESGESPDQAYWELTLDYGLAAFAALAEWSTMAAAQLKSMGTRAK